MQSNTDKPLPHPDSASNEFHFLSMGSAEYNPRTASLNRIVKRSTSKQQLANPSSQQDQQTHPILGSSEDLPPVPPIPSQFQSHYSGYHNHHQNYHYSNHQQFIHYQQQQQQLEGSKTGWGSSTANAILQDQYMSVPMARSASASSTASIRNVSSSGINAVSTDCNTFATPPSPSGTLQVPSLGQLSQQQQYQQYPQLATSSGNLTTTSQASMGPATANAVGVGSYVNGSGGVSVIITPRTSSMANSNNGPLSAPVVGGLAGASNIHSLHQSAWRTGADIRQEKLDRRNAMALADLDTNRFFGVGVGPSSSNKQSNIPMNFHYGVNGPMSAPISPASGYRAQLGPTVGTELSGNVSAPTSTMISPIILTGPLQDGSVASATHLLSLPYTDEKELPPTPPQTLPQPASPHQPKFPTNVILGAALGPHGHSLSAFSLRHQAAIKSPNLPHVSTNNVLGVSGSAVIATQSFNAPGSHSSTVTSGPISAQPQSAATGFGAGDGSETLDEAIGNNNALLKDESAPSLASNSGAFEAKAPMTHSKIFEKVSVASFQRYI
jgi:hypothetical protein